MVSTRLGLKKKTNSDAKYDFKFYYVFSQCKRDKKTIQVIYDFRNRLTLS